MITKRNGNGQTECVGCKEKNKNMPLTWDSWLYTFNGKPYCQECLFEMLEEYQQRIDNALKIAFEYSQIDGSHHKAWVIDQMIRSLLGDDYKKWVEKYMFDGQDPIEAVQNENYFKVD